MRVTIDGFEVYAMDDEHTATDWKFFGRTNVEDELEQYFESLDNEDYLTSISMTLKDSDGNDIDPVKIVNGKIEVALTIDGEKTKVYSFECSNTDGFPYSFPIKFPKDEEE